MGLQATWKMVTVQMKEWFGQSIEIISEQCRQRTGQETDDRGGPTKQGLSRKSASAGVQR